MDEFGPNFGRIWAFFRQKKLRFRKPSRNRDLISVPKITQFQRDGLNPNPIPKINYTPSLKLPVGAGFGAAGPKNRTPPPSHSASHGGGGQVE